MNALAVRGLTIELAGRTVVDDVTLTVAAGEVLAVVGESGAGKSLLVRSFLGLHPQGANVRADELRVAGTDVSAFTEGQWRTVRGETIGLVSQDALGALDPLRRVGAEVAEPLAIHTHLARSERRQRAESALAAAGVPEPHVRATQYPHELSGGLRQRAVIASIAITEPDIIVADEPTTALDATVQRRVLLLLRRLADAGRAVVLVTHDLNVVADIADRIAVMRHGQIVEQGTAAGVLSAPQHAYTRELWAAGTRAQPRGNRGTRGDGPAALTATGLVRRFGDRTAVDQVDLELRAGSILGIVGESGSGKTTLARLLLGAERPDAGTVRLAESETATAGAVQLVAQHPRAAFNPTWTIARTLAEALAARAVPRRARPAAVAALLRDVELEPALARRRPHQLSGGQLQRVAIARALAMHPRVLVLDEPLSALDVAVGARILALLERIREESGVAMAIISHDLGVVGAIADRIIVMRDGTVVEAGDTHTVFACPAHAFTRELLSAAGRDLDAESSPGSPSGTV